MKRFAKKILDKFARIEGYDKKPYPNWKAYKNQMMRYYRTGLGNARENPLTLKDLEELAEIAAKTVTKKEESKNGTRN